MAYPAAAPMMVRIEPLPGHVPDAVEKWDQARFSASAGQTPGEKVGPGPISQAATDASALRLAPDPLYYPALDLDTYPWPLAPLQLEKLEGARAGEVRLEMLVDETGVVRDVVFVQPAHPGPMEEGLRAVLAATPFAPGRKDGRPVKSRLILGITSGVRSP